MACHNYDLMVTHLKGKINQMKPDSVQSITMPVFTIVSCVSKLLQHQRCQPQSGLIICSSCFAKVQFLHPVKDTKCPSHVYSTHLYVLFSQ